MDSGIESTESSNESTNDNATEMDTMNLRSNDSGLETFTNDSSSNVFHFSSANNSEKNEEDDIRNCPNLSEISYSSFFKTPERLIGSNEARDFTDLYCSDKRLPYQKPMPEFSFQKPYPVLSLQGGSIPEGSKLKLNFPNSVPSTYGDATESKPTNSSFTISKFDIPCSNLNSQVACNSLYGPLAVLPYENRDLQRKFNHYKHKIRQMRDLLHQMKPKEKHLRTAASLNNTELVEYFLAEGINPNCVDSRRRTPLHIAASKGYTDVVKLLLQYGADPNQKDSIGNTPLHLAACTSHVETVTQLLKGGTNVKLADNQGFSPLNLANARLTVFKKLQQSSLEVKSDVLKIIDMMKAYLKSAGKSEDAETLASLTDKLSLSDSNESSDDDLKSLLNSLQDLTLNKSKVD